jgi:hypothetical protein
MGHKFAENSFIPNKEKNKTLGRIIENLIQATFIIFGNLSIIVGKYSDIFSRPLSRSVAAASQTRIYFPGLYPEVLPQLPNKKMSRLPGYVNQPKKSISNKRKK